MLSPLPSPEHELAIAKKLEFDADPHTWSRKFRVEAFGATPQSPRVCAGTRLPQPVLVW